MHRRPLYGSGRLSEGRPVYWSKQSHGQDRGQTGRRVRVTRLIGVYTDSALLLEYPDGNRWQIVVLHFAAEPIAGSLRGSDETTDVRYFSQVDTHHLAMSRFNHQRIADAFAGLDAPFVRDDIDLE